MIEKQATPTKENTNKNKEVCNEFFKNKDTWLTNNPKYL